MVKVNIYRLDHDEKLPFKVTETKPILKFYPNEKTNDEKIEGSK